MANIPPVGSIDKALRALQHLGDAGADGLSLSRLANDLDINKATLHMTLAGLRHRAFVEQDGNGNYRVGPSLLAIADSHAASLRLVMGDGLKALCRTVGETCHLGVLRGEQVIYVDKAEPPQSFPVSSQVGWGNPALVTALGRAIVCRKYVDFDTFASHFPSGIPKRTPYSVTSITSIWAELVASRERGYAKEEQEAELDLMCVAVAIIRGSETVGSVGVSVPVSRMNARYVEFILRSIRSCLEPMLPVGLFLQKPLIRTPSEHSAVFLQRKRRVGT